MRTALIYSIAAREPWRAAARQGGPMGEILVAESLTFGLEKLGYRVVQVGALRDFAKLTWLGFARQRFNCLFFDPFTLANARSYQLVRDAERSLVLEWFGTAPEMVDRKIRNLNAARYLTPYPYEYGWNTFLGFILFHGGQPGISDEVSLRTERRDGLAHKRGQGVIWAKEPRYLSGAGAMLASLASVCPLHATLDAQSAAALPSGVINHGHLSRSAWRELLRQSNFVIGLGDPVSGPTALEALAQGCVYINPAFEPPRQVNDVSALTIRSQHPYAAGLGAPFVHTIDVTDTDAVVGVADASLRLASGEDDESRLMEHLLPFTEDAYVARLQRILADLAGR